MSDTVDNPGERAGHSSRSRLDEVREGVLTHAFHRACGLELVLADAGRAEIRFAVNDFTANPQGALHGGIVYAMIDVACFFAVVPALASDQHPVSVETHVSILRPALHGDQIRIVAWTDRVGRSLASMRAEVFLIGGEAKLIATGTVTKSILQGRGR